MTRTAQAIVLFVGHMDRGEQMDDFDHHDFHEAERQFRALIPQLPDDALHDLAKEVVGRVASQFSADPIILSEQDDEIQTLCTALIGHDPEGAVSIVRDLRRKDVPLQEIYLDYLAAAAARLGKMWEEDAVSFTDVTLGTGRIYAAMRAARAGLKPARITRPNGVYFTAVPGEEHMVGVKMAADLFRRSGWEVMLSQGMDHDAILQEIDQSGLALVGLSASGKTGAAPLARLIVALRLEQPQAKILVSGRIVTSAMDLVQLMRPDATASTLPAALDVMAGLSQALKTSTRIGAD